MLPSPDRSDEEKIFEVGFVLNPSLDEFRGRLGKRSAGRLTYGRS
jgi:hypothetical protein